MTTVLVLISPKGQLLHFFFNWSNVSTRFLCSSGNALSAVVTIFDISFLSLEWSSVTMMARNFEYFVRKSEVFASRNVLKKKERANQLWYFPAISCMTNEVACMEVSLIPLFLFFCFFHPSFWVVCSSPPPPISPASVISFHLRLGK